jgi:hypothetical protein
MCDVPLLIDVPREDPKGVPSRMWRNLVAIPRSGIIGSGYPQVRLREFALSVLRSDPKLEGSGGPS